MAFFSKKYCDICGEKIGLLGNKKLADGNMCKNCEGFLSPYIADRRNSSVEEIEGHLEYRYENEAEVDAFNVTRTLGGHYKVLIDDHGGKFLVTGYDDWQDGNPDVIPLSQVTGCHIEVRENRTELTWEDSEGDDISFSPKQYDIDYDFFITVYINWPWFNEMTFDINERRVDHYGSAEYREMERRANEIKEALTQGDKEAGGNAGAGSGPAMARLCPYCGATTIPDARGCCEFCGGAMQ